MSSVRTLSNADVQEFKPLHPDPARLRERVVEAVRTIPGVQSAATIDSLPFSADCDSTTYFFEDSQHVVRSTSAYMQSAGEDLFRTMGISLLKGRDFNSADNPTGMPVAIIDTELADLAFGDNDPIGRRITTRELKGLSWHTVVGVIATIKRNRLSDAKGNATVNLPMQQSTSRIFRIVIRSEMPIDNLLGPLRSAIAHIDPEQPVSGITTMDARIDDSLTERRTRMLLLALFASCALALSGIGIYRAIAFSVSRRTSEIGVRISLGATRVVIFQLVLGDGARLVFIGVAIGSVLALMLGQILRSQLFRVSMIDPLSIIGTLTVVIATALLAGSQPDAQRRRAHCRPFVASDRWVNQRVMPGAPERPAINPYSANFAPAHEPLEDPMIHQQARADLLEVSFEMLGPTLIYQGQNALKHIL